MDMGGAVAARCTLCRAPTDVITGLCPCCHCSAEHVLMQDDRGPMVLTPGRAVRFGRSLMCEVRISDPTVSRVHAELEWDGAQRGPTLIDRGRWGTLVNGRPILGPRTLRSGDVVEMREFRVRYVRRQTEHASVAEEVDHREATGLALEPVLQGSIGPFGLKTVFQALEAGSRTGTLFVFGATLGPGSCWLAVREGQPLQAEVDGLRGVEAALELLRLQQGRYLFSEDVEVFSRAIHTSLTSLLLEAARREDKETRGLTLLPDRG